MKIEHVAYTVAEPAKVAQWYVQHLGLRITRAQTAQPFTHFLADRGDHVMIEIYNNPKVKVPDYRTIDPLLLHIAFTAEDMTRDRARLLAAGATIEADVLKIADTGDELLMMRDPWGFAIQLVKRGKKMI